MTGRNGTLGGGLMMIAVEIVLEDVLGLDQRRRGNAADQETLWIARVTGIER